MPKLADEMVWAGSTESHQIAMRAEESRETRLEALVSKDSDPDEQPSRLLEVRDGLGIVSIKGPLVNDDDARWNATAGMTGYPEIRQALIEAAHAPHVKHILLDIDSGGGSVSGVSDTGKLIRTINDRIKGVTAYTDSSMYSAAYWLGAAAGSVHASKSAGVGSIGIIATHVEHSERLKESGIGVTVIRAGKWKALANSYEKLTDEGRSVIQARVDAAYKDFVDYVAEMRGKSAEFVDTVMAQGREFNGRAAADAGLVDSITTFDELVSTLQEKNMDTSKSFMDNLGKQSSGLRVESNGDATNMAKKTLTEADIAALAAGASLEATATTDVQPEPEVQAEAKADAGADAGAENEASDEAKVETIDSKDEKVDASASTIKYMADELKAVREDLFAARLALSKIEDKNAEMDAVVGPLKDIAAKAINNMRVAMSASPMDMASLSAVQILADYTSMSAAFTSKFKAGGVAAVSVDESAKPKSASPQHMARVNAARHQK